MAGLLSDALPQPTLSDFPPDAKPFGQPAAPVPVEAAPVLSDFPVDARPIAPRAPIGPAAQPLPVVTPPPAAPPIADWRDTFQPQPVDVGEPASPGQRLVRHLSEAFNNTLAGETINRVQSGQVGQRVVDDTGRALREARAAGSVVALDSYADGTPSPYAGVPLDKLGTMRADTFVETEGRKASFGAARADETRAFNDMTPATDLPATSLQGIVDRGAAVIGALAGGLPSPESLTPIGRGATLARTAAKGAVGNAAIAAAVDPVVQGGQIERGEKQSLDPGQTAEHALISGILGGGIHVAPQALTTLRGSLSKWFGKPAEAITPADLAGMSPEDVTAALREAGLADRQLGAVDPNSQIARDAAAAAKGGDAAPAKELADTADAFELARRQKAARRDPSEPFTDPPTEREAYPGAAGREDATRAFDQVDLQQRRGNRTDTSEVPLQREVSAQERADADAKAAFDLADVQRRKGADYQAGRATKEADYNSGQHYDQLAERIGEDPAKLVEDQLGVPRNQFHEMPADARERVVAAAQRQRGAEAPETEVRRTSDAAHGDEPYSPASRPDDSRGLAGQTRAEEIGGIGATDRVHGGNSDRPFKTSSTDGATPEQVAGFERRADERTTQARAASEDELLRSWERRRNTAGDREQQARDHYAGENAKTSNKPGPQGQDGSFATDDFGFVRSDAGGPIKFGDQKQAARWIINVGHKLSPDQIFEIVNHPGKNGGYSVRETGRSAPKDKPSDGGSTGEAADSAAGSPKADADSITRELADLRKQHEQEMQSRGQAFDPAQIYGHAEPHTRGGLVAVGEADRGGASSAASKDAGRADGSADRDGGGPRNEPEAEGGLPGSDRAGEREAGAPREDSGSGRGEGRNADPAAAPEAPAEAPVGKPKQADAKAAKAKAVDDLEGLAKDSPGEWHDGAKAQRAQDVLGARREAGKSNADAAERMVNRMWQAAEKGEPPRGFPEKMPPGGYSGESRWYARARDWLEENPRPDAPESVPYTLKRAGGGETQFELKNNPDSIREVAKEVGKMRLDRFYSNPLGDPDLWRGVIEPWRKSLKDFLGDLRSAREDRGGSAITHGVRAVAYSADGWIRSIAKKFKSDALDDVINQFHAKAGEGGEAGRTFDEAAHMRSNQRLGDLSKALGQFIDDPDKLKQIVALVRNPRTIRTGTPLGDAAEAVRKLLAAETKYHREAGLEVGVIKDGYFPLIADEAKVRSRPDAFKAKAEQAYRASGLGASEAKLAAENWTNHILLGDKIHTDTPFSRPGADAESSFMKGRSISKSGEDALSSFLLSDPRQVLARYLVSSTRRAELARRFGDNWSRWNEIEADIRAQGAGDSLPALRDYVRLASGLQPPGLSSGTVAALSWVRTFGALGTLAHAAFSSLVEPTLAAVRTGNLGDAFSAYATAVRESVRRAAKSGPSEARAFAEDLGVISAALHDNIMSARWAGGDPTSQLQQKVLSNFFRRTYLEQWTNDTRIAMSEIGRTFIRRLAIDMKDGGDAVTQRYLAELGVPSEKAEAFAKWLRATGDGRPSASEITGGNGDIYRTAIHRFADQTILRPTTSTRPKWASHPLGAVLFQLQSYQWAFTHNVLNRLALQARDAGTPGNGLSMAERARLLQPLAAMPLFVGVNALIQEGRETLFGTPGAKKKTDGEKALTYASRSNLFGNLDPYVNLATHAKYRADVLQKVAGPQLGRTAGVIGAALEFGSNVDSRSNGKARNFAKAIYDTAIVPVANFALTAAPVGPVSAVASQALQTGRAREGFADLVAGKKPPARSTR